MVDTDSTWKTKTIIIATAVGAVSGLAAGLLLTRTADEKGGGPPKLRTADTLRLAVGVIGLVRGIAALGDPK